MQTLPPPRFLFLTINNRCNLRCTHCVYWQSDSRAGSVATKLRFIEEFAGFASPGAAVVICGGESTLDFAPYMEIAAACRSVGVRCLSVINGTTVKNLGRARELVEHGPTEITVSLDSHEHEEHDAVRGVKGSHEMACRAVRLLLEARGAASLPRIYVMAVVSERNYRSLGSFYEFVLRELGADKLKLNFLQPTFGGGSERDPYFEENHIRSPADAISVIRACDLEFGLRLSPEWISVVETYLSAVVSNENAIKGWEHEHGTPAAICNSYLRNIMVDESDHAHLCFNTKFPAVKLHPGELEEFWSTATWRHAMAECRMYCGISHSVRAVSATAVPQPGA